MKKSVVFLYLWIFHLSLHLPPDHVWNICLCINYKLSELTVFVQYQYLNKKWGIIPNVTFHRSKDNNVNKKRSLLGLLPLVNNHCIINNINKKIIKDIRLIIHYGGHPFFLHIRLSHWLLKSKRLEGQFKKKVVDL